MEFKGMGTSELKYHLLHCCSFCDHVQKEHSNIVLNTNGIACRSFCPIDKKICGSEKSLLNKALKIRSIKKLKKVTKKIVKKIKKGGSNAN